MNVLKKHWSFILLGLIFLCHLFFQFYNLRPWITFGFDQVDNAWAAVRILIEHNYPMVGMVAKNSSGIYIGPLYYYLVALFYWITNFDPVASPLLAGATSIFSFSVLYAVTKKLWNERVALWSVFIYTFSYKIILADRVQWPVNFIAPLGLLVFYNLYRVLTGNPKYILYLSLIVGTAFHIHFTTILYAPIILATLPWFPRKQETLWYILGGVGIVGIFLLPNILFILQHHAIGSMQAYGQESILGFHLRRMLQVSHDAFIQYELIFPWPSLRPFVFVWIPLTVVATFLQKRNIHRFTLSYLFALWFLVPWIVFTLFKGEITDYYFSLNRFVAVATIAVIIDCLWTIKSIIPKILLCTAAGVFAYTTISFYSTYTHANDVPLSMIRYAEDADKNGITIRYEDGQAIPFLYYIDHWKKGIPRK